MKILQTTFEKAVYEFFVTLAPVWKIFGIIILIALFMSLIFGLIKFVSKIREFKKIRDKYKTKSKKK